AYAALRSVCLRPSCFNVDPPRVGSVDAILHRHAVEYSTYPRGPRSGPGYSVPVRHHLIGPIRPTRGHIAISPFGLYAMPSCAGAPRRPASGSELSLHILSWHAVPCDPGESEHRQFQTAMSAWPSPRINRLGTPNDPAIRFTREVNFGAT